MSEQRDYADLQAELDTIRAENADLRRQVESLADANVYAAMLVQSSKKHVNAKIAS